MTHKISLLPADELQASSSCEVICFPLVWRTQLINRSAEVLAKRKGKRAERYWVDLIKSIEKDLLAARIPADQIRKEVEAFAQVLAEKMSKIRGI